MKVPKAFAHICVRAVVLIMFSFKWKQNTNNYMYYFSKNDFWGKIIFFREMRCGRFFKIEIV